MLPDRNEPVMRVIPMPADTNFHGDIFGGWLLGQVDLAGSVAAVRRAKGRVATVGIEALVTYVAVGRDGTKRPLPAPEISSVV